MNFRFINNNKLNKKVTFALCIGVILGIKVCSMQTNSINDNINNTPTIDNSVEDMTITEKLENRGGVHIYFNNKEYCPSETDSIAFFNNEGEGQGVVTNKHDDYIITFVPGEEYNYYIHSLGASGSLEINDIGEQYQMIIDYKTMTYQIESSKPKQIENR